MVLYSSNGSYHNGLVDQMTAIPLRTPADFDNYLKRIGLVKSRIEAYGAMSAAAARKGYVQPCVTETQLPKSISGVVASDPTKSRFYEPFAAARPTSITEADWSALQNRARDIIVDTDQSCLSESRHRLCARRAAALLEGDRRIGATAGPRLLCLAGALSYHHEPDGRRHSPARHERSRAHPGRDGRGRAQGRLPISAGDDRARCGAIRSISRRTARN